MLLVLLPLHTQSPDEHEDIARARDDSHRPYTHPQHQQIQQVVDRGYTVAFRRAVTDIRRVSAIVKATEETGYAKQS